jgi:hypothetical protein
VAFVTAGPAVAAAAAPPTSPAPAENSSETAFSGSRKSAVSAKSPAAATMIPTYAQIYNGGAACEVTFRRIEA